MGNVTVSLKPHDPVAVQTVELPMCQWLSTLVFEMERSRSLASELAVAQTIRLIHHPPKGSPVFQREISAEGLYNQFHCHQFTLECASRLIETSAMEPSRSNIQMTSMSLKLKAGYGLPYSG